MQTWAKESIWICTPKDEIDQIQRSQGDIKGFLASEEDEAVEPVWSY